MLVYGEGLLIWVFVMIESFINNYEFGLLIQIYCDLDVVIQGDGWFVVQDKQGNEVYI